MIQIIQKSFIIRQIKKYFIVKMYVYVLIYVYIYKRTKEIKKLNKDSEKLMN